MDIVIVSRFLHCKEALDTAAPLSGCVLLHARLAPTRRSHAPHGGHTPREKCIYGHEFIFNFSTLRKEQYHHAIKA